MNFFLNLNVIVQKRSTDKEKKCNRIEHREKEQLVAICFTMAFADEKRLDFKGTDR